jgi:microcystin-dependent protein
MSSHVLSSKIRGTELSTINGQSILSGGNISISYTMPAGIIVSFVGVIIPSGWLLCNGSTFSRDTYPNLYIMLGNSNVLPDLRGYFIRGLDNSAGRDSGRTILTTQVDSTALPNNSFETNITGNHTHWISSAQRDDGNGSSMMNNNQNYGLYADAGTYSSADPNFPYGRYCLNAGNHSHTITSGGDSETRPMNVALNYIISAS